MYFTINSCLWICPLIFMKMAECLIRKWLLSKTGCMERILQTDITCTLHDYYLNP